MFIGVSGLNSFATALEVVSDNVANVNTTGYKASTTRFGDLVSAYYATTTSTAEREGSGTAILAMPSNFGQGPLVNTGTWSDRAINGDLLLQRPDQHRRYISNQDGSFRVIRTVPVNFNGYQVLDSGK
jgi:flagellar hook protein FlgE